MSKEIPMTRQGDDRTEDTPVGAEGARRATGAATGGAASGPPEPTGSPNASIGRSRSRSSMAESSARSTSCVSPSRPSLSATTPTGRSRNSASSPRQRRGYGRHWPPPHERKLVSRQPGAVHSPANSTVPWHTPAVWSGILTLFVGVTRGDDREQRRAERGSPDP